MKIENLKELWFETSFGKVKQNVITRVLTLYHQLTNTQYQNINKDKFEQQIIYIFENKFHTIYLLRDKDDKIVAMGTLLIEPKLIHNISFVGHIEDVVVDEKERGKGYGKHIVSFLIKKAQEKKCYKVILDAKEKNKKFYEKLGFTPSQLGFSIYF